MDQRVRLTIAGPKEQAMARGDGYDQILSLWSIQESLLQTYRSIFITAESVIFAIAAAITGTTPWSALILTFLGYFLLWMWHRVCANRALDVSFTQWLLDRAERGANVSAPLACLKSFQDGQTITIDGRSVCRHPNNSTKEHVNDDPFISMGKSRTRVWMERYLPLLFAVLWVIVAWLAVQQIYP